MPKNRLAVWRPWINRFGLFYEVIKRHPERYTVEFADRLKRCNDDTRRLMLGIKETA